MMNTILLSVIAVLMLANILVSGRREKMRRLDIQELIAQSIHSFFDQEIKELSKAYAEERHLVQWIEELAKNDELDLLEISSVAEQRAHALAIKKAEEAVTLAESAMGELNKEIANRQKQLFKDSSIGMSRHVEDDKKALREMLAQEKFVRERLEKSRENLHKLAV